VLDGREGEGVKSSEGSSERRLGSQADDSDLMDDDVTAGSTTTRACRVTYCSLRGGTRQGGAEQGKGWNTRGARIRFTIDITENRRASKVIVQRVHMVQTFEDSTLTLLASAS
jgi:hypothetical protein